MHLRDSEREQLARQALSLCTQSLRDQIKSMGAPKSTDQMKNTLAKTDSRTLVVLDVYQIQIQVQNYLTLQLELLRFIISFGFYCQVT